MAYVQVGTITKNTTVSGYRMNMRLTLYEDQSVTPNLRRVYIDEFRIYATAYALGRLAGSDPTVLFSMAPYESTSTKFVDIRLDFSRTIITEGSDTYIKTSAPGYYSMPIPSTAPVGREYQYNLYGSLYYKNSQDKGQLGQFSIINYFIFPRYLNTQITAPATVTLNALNEFNCESVDLSSIPGYSSAKTFTAYGAFGQNYERTSDIYSSSSSKITMTSAFNKIYWYPSILQVASGDFINNTSRYKIIFELTSTDAGLDDNRLAWGEITGTIQYNETPPANAKPAVSVAVTEISGVGLFATYGRYLVGKSQIRLTASISAPFGYGQSILTRTITLNGVTASANQTVWPTVDGTYYAAAVDNHNASNNASLSYQVYDYWEPELSTFAIHRCRQDGTNDDAGAYVKIEWGIHVAPLGNQNSKSLTITHPQGTATPALSSYDASGVLIVAADIEHSYDITATLTDDLGGTTRTLRLSTAGAIMDIHNGGDGIAFGKVAELPDTLEVSPDWEVILNTTDAKKISLVDALMALATATGVDIYVHSNNS